MNAADHVYSTALFHHRAGNLRKAEAQCRRALRKESEHAESLHLLGMMASESGNQKLAASLIVRAIKSAGALPNYCVNLGLVMSRDGQPEAAASCYKQALRTASALSGEAEAHFELGNLLHMAGEVDQAIEHFRVALGLRPEFPEAWFNLGVSLMRQRRADEALGAYVQALMLKPRYPEALNNYGIMLQTHGRLGEAAASYLKAMECKPDYVDPRYNLGAVRQEQERHAEALELYDGVLRLNPDHAEALNYRGNVLLALGDPQAAVAAYSGAIQRQPDHPQANWNLGLANLLLGRFADGWRGYEWRLRQPGAGPRLFPVPLWTGAHTGSARILVHSEQGFGDTLQFIRYAPMVRERCGFLIVECQEPLARTLDSVAGIDQVVARGTELPDFDFHVPLLSLPAVFATVEETIPASAPYIVAPAGLREKWQEWIPASTDLRAGLVWAGNPNHKNDANRSIPPECLAPLFALAGIRFYSLQKNLAVAGAIPLGLELSDFADTSAAIANLDLVISVDTAVAHLTGAMNKPVWTLLPFNPDWRWMLKRPDTPWYPGMRLFRQAEPKDWGSVISLVASELSNLVLSRAGNRKEPCPVC